MKLLEKFASILKLVAIPIIALCIVVACSDNPTTQTTATKGGNTFQSQCDFENTRWKLVSFVDVLNATDSVPANLNHIPSYSYTIRFIGVSSFLGAGIMGSFPPTKYEVDCNNYTISIAPLFDDCCLENAGDFYQTLLEVEEFYMDSDTLKLFYNNGNNYLLFNYFPF